MLLLALLLATDRYQPADIPESAVGQLTHATQAMSAGDLAGAATELEQIISGNPSYFLAHYDLGVVYQQMGRLEDSARELKRAKDLNDSLKLGEASIGASLGWIRYLQHDYSAAQSLTKSSLESPNFTLLDVQVRRDIFNNLANIYTAQRRPCQAQLYHDLGTSKAPEGAASAPAELEGNWILMRWRARAVTGTYFPVASSDPEGVLKIDPGAEGTAYKGTLTLCVGQHWTDRPVEEFTISKDGLRVSLVGKVTQGSGIWSDDRLATTLDGLRMSGTDSDNQGVAFTKVF
jgi:tetratricopeptide (TPR) repeat protein